MLNFFVTLTNVIKVPVLFIGTPKALELFQPTMRSARRAAQFGSLDWGRFARTENTGSDEEWERFFKRLWKLQWFEHSTPFTDEMMDLFWEYTQGIAHIAVALFYLSQVRAVVAGRESIDRTIVTKVYQEELAMMHPMIAALRSGREATILQYADLDVPREALRVQSALQKAPQIPVDQRAQTDAQSSKLERLIAILGQMGIGEDIAAIVAEQALEERPDEDLFSLVAHIKKLEEKTPAQPETKAGPQKKEKLRPVYLKDDLRLTRDEDSEATYRSLKKRGVIIELSAYL
jgi:hypothetical protein